ncbi:MULTISPECIES: hypothetical protein [Pectobacteriaceae]|uniref:Uncharacterized protein n=1 Tax=Musicola paradisiaca (strain Ech703) TaxID=579405 RepID=C6C5G3_MUSP7|nr:hypothetical protein [Musicola paradisiaca]ACS87600.1 hypothetical protein Dd703_3847 [Musicola paradisiaca Ech703]
MEGENKVGPSIMRGDLTDDELIEFLLTFIKKLEARESLKERPEKLRASADSAERELDELNEFISSVLHQHN